MRLTPAGPDHAQQAASGAVLDYVEALHRHHGGQADDLRTIAADVSARWRASETAHLADVLGLLAAAPNVRLLGPAEVGDPAGGLHRCPTVAFVPLRAEPVAVEAALVDRGIMCSSGHYYAYRVLDGLDVDPRRGVVRVSWVHYTDRGDIDRLLNALDDVLAA